MYEVLPTEPLHYIKEHVSNVVTEIVAHLSDEEKALCKKAVELVQEHETNFVVQTTERCL